MATSTLTKRGKTRTKKNKPKKPRRDYPLSAHPCGQWCKKVRGQLYYFGTWDDPVAAEELWDKQKTQLLRGEVSAAEAAQTATLADLINSFLTYKENAKNEAELTQRAFNDYRRTCERFVEHVDRKRLLTSLRSSDFEDYRSTLPSTWGSTTRNNHFRMLRVLFKYANDTEAAGPGYSICYQVGLKGVSRKSVRKAAASKAAKEFSAVEVCQLLDQANSQSYAMILLGLNAAYGPADISRLKLESINFDTNWLGEPRGKTGIARGCWLWPETVKALRDAIKSRATPAKKEFSENVFLTRYGNLWYVDGARNFPLAGEFIKLKRNAGIVKERVGHYGLRHTFATVAADTRDQQAVDYVMGHVDNSMSATYREGIDPQRVKAVCEYVRKWFLEGKAEHAKLKRKAKQDRKVA